MTDRGKGWQPVVALPPNAKEIACYTGFPSQVDGSDSRSPLHPFCAHVPAKMRHFRRSVRLFLPETWLGLSTIYFHLFPNNSDDSQLRAIKGLASRDGTGWQNDHALGGKGDDDEC
jgi:hypothetical protein